MCDPIAFNTCEDLNNRLAQYKECLSGRVSRTPIERNNLAYYRGLANKELSKAAIDIEKAIHAEESEYRGFRFLMPLQVRATVAAGLISRHIDQQESVLPALNAKIDQYEQRIARQMKATKARITREMQSQFPFDKSLEDQFLLPRGNQEVQKNCLGMMLATRAFVLEDLERQAETDRDRIRVSELGFDFDELAGDLPSDQSCLLALQTSTLFLDTRGFVSGLREWENELAAENRASSLSIDDFAESHGKRSGAQIKPSSYREALEDLNLAVLSAQFLQKTWDSPLANTPELSARMVAAQKRSATHMTAVLLYHRVKVHLRGGNKRAAEADRQRITELGVDPNSSLF